MLSDVITIKKPTDDTIVRFTSEFTLFFTTFRHLLFKSSRFLS